MVVVAPLAPPPVRGHEEISASAPEEISALAVGKEKGKTCEKSPRKPGGELVEGKGSRDQGKTWWMGSPAVQCAGSPHGEGPPGRGEAAGVPGFPSALGLPPVWAALGLKGIVEWEGEGTEQDWGSGAGLGRIHRCQSHRSESWDLGKGKGEPLLPAAHLHFPRLSLWDFCVLHRWGGSSRRKGGVGALLAGRTGLRTTLRT